MAPLLLWLTTQSHYYGGEVPAVMDVERFRSLIESARSVKAPPPTPDADPGLANKQNERALAEGMR